MSKRDGNFPGGPPGILPWGPTGGPPGAHRDFYTLDRQARPPHEYKWQREVKRESAYRLRVRTISPSRSTMKTIVLEPQNTTNQTPFQEEKINWKGSARDNGHHNTDAQHAFSSHILSIYSLRNYFFHILFSPLSMAFSLRYLQQKKKLPNLRGIQISIRYLKLFSVLNMTQV